MRVLWISECPWVASGFGKVTYYMLKGLKNEGLDCIAVCFSTFAKIQYDGIPVYPYGNPLKELIEYLEKKHGEIDVVVYHGAPWITPLNQILPQNKTIKKKTIGYFVHEFINAPKNIKNTFKLVHLLAVPSKFIADVVEINRYVKIIHGVNPSVFYPRINKNNDTIIIGMVAKNHPRKLWDYYFRILAELRKKGYKVKGLPYVFDKGYYNIRQLITGIQEYYNTNIEFEYTTPYDVFYGVLENEEAEILSKMNIHVLLTRGEGFALPIAETLALGIPNITLDFPVMKEIYGNLIEYIEPIDIYISPSEGTIHYTPNIYHAIQKITAIIEHYEEYREKALKASEWVRKHLTWEKATKQMIRAIDEVMKYDNLIIQDEQEKTHIPINLKPKVIE